MHRLAFSFVAVMILASVTFTLLASTPFSYTVWVDSLFLISLFVTMIGAILFIIEKGFINPIINNFKYFISKISKRRQIADEIEQKSNHGVRNLPKKYFITFPCLEAGILLLLVSICFFIIQLYILLFILIFGNFI